MKHKVMLAISTLALCGTVTTAEAAKHKTISHHATAHKTSHSVSKHHSKHAHTVHHIAHRNNSYHPYTETHDDGSVSGTASLYSTKLHGRRTASGEPYDMFGYTAAHRTLPLMSYVEVTNLENNQTVVVQITDRGPFRGHHMIDLSTAAAEELGLNSTGKVKITPVEVDAKADF